MSTALQAVLLVAGIVLTLVLSQVRAINRRRDRCWTEAEAQRALYPTAGRDVIALPLERRR